MQQLIGFNHKCGMSAAKCPVEGVLFHADRRTEMTKEIVTLRISNATEKLRRLMIMPCFQIFCWLVIILNSHKSKTTYATQFPCPGETWLRVTNLDVPFIYITQSGDTACRKWWYTCDWDDLGILFAAHKPTQAIIIVSCCCTCWFWMLTGYGNWCTGPVIMFRPSIMESWLSDLLSLHFPFYPTLHLEFCMTPTFILHSLYFINNEISF
jgi:hypothetical protein